MWHGGSKYHAKKTVVDNLTFDSKREADRYLVLKSMEEDGVIEDVKGMRTDVYRLKSKLVAYRYGMNIRET